MISRLLLSLAVWTMLVVPCAAGPGGGVRPAPPGPIDLLRMGIWGDYSGLCPKHYDFCRAGRRSICCPMSSGCCGDENGPYCCAAPPYDERYMYEKDLRTRGEYTCAARDITCSHGGRTICCYSKDRCCADENGPYCCADRDSGASYERHERTETRRSYDDNDNED